MDVLRSNILMNETKSDRFVSDDKRHPTQALGGLYGSNGFFFQQRRGHLNLRSLASINLEKLVREVDIDLLQSHIENITFCNLREEDLRYLTDPQVVKLFRVSQLMLEYLLYSQDQLVENLNNLSHKYTEKKRSITKKRREMVELEESVKQLRNQVKAKKQNIETLEDLIKETNKTRERELRQIKKGQQLGIPASDLRPSKVKFFIAGPEGLCVEFTMNIETEISYLLKEARKAFVSKRDREHDSDDVDIKLIYKGKVLLEPQTIESCEIQNGDTLMILIDRRKELPQIVKVAPVPVPVNTVDPAPPPVDKGDTKLLLEFLSQQQQSLMKELVHDINNSWQSALQTISTQATMAQQSSKPPDETPQLLADLNTRWSKTELGLREKISQLETMQINSDKELSTLSVLATRRRLKLGELESDNDDVPRNSVDIAPLNSRIDNLQKQAVDNNSDLETLKALIRSQNDELIQLKTMISEQKKERVVDQMKVIPPVEVESVTLRNNRWNDIIASAGEAPDDSTTVGKPSKVFLEVIEPIKPAATHSVVETRQVIPSVEVIMENSQPLIQVTPSEPQNEARTDFVEEIAVVTVEMLTSEVIQEPPVSAIEEPVDVLPSPLTIEDIVHVVFPAKYNRISKNDAGGSDFQVTVKADASVDDMFFQLRQEAAKQAQTNFDKVALNYKGKRVVFGTDIDSRMTAESAARYAASGDLRLVIGRPITNSQIDMLTSSIDNSGNSAWRSSIQKRDWKEDEEISTYNQLKSSLDEVLTDVSDKEGLSADEYEASMSKLKASFTDKLPTEFSKNMRSFKGSVASAIAASGVDVGSEDHSYHSGSSGDDSRFRSKPSNRDGPGSKAGGAALLRLSQSSTSNDRMRSSLLGIGRRSIEQFDNEFRYRNDDMVMFKSVSNSIDYLRPGIADSITSIEKEDKPMLTYVSPPISIQSQPSRYLTKDDDYSDEDPLDMKIVNFDADDKRNTSRWESSTGTEGARKSVDSVDSAKREYLTNKNRVSDVGENKEELKSTGESSTVQTFDDSLGSLNDDSLDLGNTADYTVESVRKSAVRREADMYELNAQSNNSIRGFSSDSFADDDSLVFSESNNFDDM